MAAARTPCPQFDYVERNRGASVAIVLLHGFSDDARTWDAPLALDPFAQAYRYQWFFATERGAAAPRDDASALCRHLWRVFDS